MPASTPQEAMDKWERKTSQEAWEEGINNPRRSVSEGLAAFWGGSANDYSGVQSEWDSEVQAAADNNTYEENTSGKGDVWMERAREGVQD